MMIERALGILEGRWKILLKWIDVPLQNTFDLVIAYIWLHNVCISGGDLFDMEWTKEAEVEAKKKIQSTFGDMNLIDLFNVAEYVIKKMIKLQFHSLNMKEMEESDGKDIE